MKPKKTKARQTLADNVKVLMKEKHWTQRNLAKVAGISQKTVSNVINPKGLVESPKLSVIEDIALAFRLNTWQLLTPGVPPKVLVSGTFVWVNKNS